MSNEITLNATLAYEDSEGTEVSLQVADKQVTVTTKITARHKQNIGTVEEAINLGTVATVGFVMFVNRDETNYIEIKDGTGGTIVGKLFPGESYGPVRLGSGMQAPFAIANTAACQMDILVLSA